MHTLHLTPSDVLFFSDGRPMSGSLAGHTAAWPAPHVFNAALHAAFHRAGLGGQAHLHRAARSGKIISEDREKDGRLFGSLLTAGPFPVSPAGAWYFPTPADLVLADDRDGPKKQPAILGFAPAALGAPAGGSLPPPLTHGVAALTPPSKDGKPPAWLRDDQWDGYLEKNSVPIPDENTKDRGKPLLADNDIADIEHQIGIGIDPGTQTQDGAHFYSAHYLRLRPGWKLGVHTKADDKGAGGKADGTGHVDLLEKLFPANNHIIIGGQQRLCAVEDVSPKKPGGASAPSAPPATEAPRHLLPRGFTEAHQFQRGPDGKYRLKWILLAPAIFPGIAADPQKNIRAHPGGWLPNWIDAESGGVLLKTGGTERLPGESRDRWRKRVRRLPAIPARLVAALVGKPVAVTGWALGGDAGGERAPAAGATRAPAAASVAGAKPVQFAVPAGSIYYFICDTPDAAAQLAAALNWHGSGATGAAIQNRRSTLLGEKGYGLGLCGAWEPAAPAAARLAAA
ncbi:MAG: type III-B CRISPR module-associated protein Cmr3, partial [Opitutaceae bacterium]|jgi:hypothetical protein|nr:type III-B CRISPR module-associated protein Cmr3 [Opitutaceae bacterium]